MANRRTISLRTKISAVTTFTVIVVALTLVGLNAYNQFNHIRKMEERFLHDSIRSAAAVSYSIMPLLVSDKFVSMNTLVSYYARRSDRLYIMVTDAHKRIMANSVGGTIGGTYQPPRAYRIDSVGEGTVRRSMTSGREAVEISYPVKAGDLLVGNVVMGLNMGWLEEEKGLVRKTLVDSTGIGLAILSLGILLASVLAKRVSRPVRLLTQAAEKVGRGDYSQRIDVRSSDEVGTLADTFDSMLGELRSARAQLVEKDYLDSILAAMKDALIVADAEGRIEMVNEAALYLLRYREDELVTRPMKTIISEEQSGKRVIEDLVGQGFIGDVEISLLSRDGRRIPVLLSGAVLESEGKVMRIVCVAKDISLRKKAEEALLESEERYRSVVENISIGISVISPGMEILSLNSTMKSWFPDIALDEKPLCYRSFYEPPKDAICSHCPTALTLKDGQVHETVTETVSEGKAVNYRVLSSPIRDRSGNVVAAIEMVENITERRRAEEALRASEARLKDAQQIAQVGDWEWDIATGGLQWSEELYRIYGYEPYEITPEYGLIVDSMHPKSREAFLGAIDAALRAGRPFEMDYTFFRRDGSEAILHTIGRVNHDNNGSPVRMVGTVQDITGRNRAEELIRASLLEKEILLKEVHHRVKNNLQVVASMLSLQSRYLADRKAKAMFEDSQRRVESMSLIHEKLYRSKDLAKIDFGEYVGDLVGGVTALNAGGPGGREVRTDIGEVKLDVHKGIPCGLIINELVSNALRHAFPDGREGEIVVSMRDDSRGISLVVSDNGAGFPGHIDFRDTRSLGMQLVVSLVNQLEGTIELDTRGGTAFTITFQA
jgi:PAS domain S-box-containing protein